MIIRLLIFLLPYSLLSSSEGFELPTLPLACQSGTKPSETLRLIDKGLINEAVIIFTELKDTFSDFDNSLKRHNDDFNKALIQIRSNPSRPNQLSEIELKEYERLERPTLENFLVVEKFSNNHLIINGSLSRQKFYSVKV